MFFQEPILVHGLLGRVYAFTRRYQGETLFGPTPIAFPHDRAYARERLYEMAQHQQHDPCNYRLHDVWQLAFQKPWTCPRNIHELVSDLADKIRRRELFVYLDKTGLEEAERMFSDEAAKAFYFSKTARSVR